MGDQIDGDSAQVDRDKGGLPVGSGDYGPQTFRASVPFLPRRVPELHTHLYPLS